MFVFYDKEEMEVRFFESFWKVCEHIAREVLDLNDLKTLELYREGLLALNRSMTRRNIEIDWAEQGQPFYV